MDNMTNDNEFAPVYQGSYAYYPAALNAPHAAPDQGTGLRKMEMAGSMEGQMPTAEALHAMRQSVGLTNRRYGATAPDAGSVEAIVSRQIDKMGLMEPENIAPAGTGNDAFPAHFDRIPGSRPPPSMPYQSPSRPIPLAKRFPRQPAAEQDFSFVRQLADNIWKERFDRLVRDLSKLSARIPAAVARSKRPVDPASYLRHMSGSRRIK